MAAAIRWYSQQLVARPIVTKTVTAVAITSAGDLACQRLQDVERVVRAKRARVRGGTRRGAPSRPRRVRVGDQTPAATRDGPAEGLEGG
jgi:hypothetical protein